MKCKDCIYFNKFRDGKERTQEQPNGTCNFNLPSLFIINGQVVSSRPIVHEDDSGCKEGHPKHERVQ